MAKRRKRRTSIRTAAGTAQQAMGERLAALRDDPLRVLPECVGEEPAPLAKIRKRLERVAAGKVGFLDKRDKGVVGAVVQSIPLADAEAYPRLADAKVAGRRRFFLQRGQVIRGCMLGVQNHDEPRALVMAYHHLAKQYELHFFAGPRLWCTGQTPRPPQPWLDALTEKIGHEPTIEGDTYRYGDADRPRMRITFRGGPSIEIDSSRCRAVGNLHAHMAAGYAGPRQRHPFEVHAIMPDGSAVEPEREKLAAYRAGVVRDSEVLEHTLRTWRGQARAESTQRRYVLADQDFGADQAAFLAALDTEPWEVDALRAMTAEGSVGRATTTAGVLEAHQSALLAGVEAILEEGAKEFLHKHAGQKPRALLRLAHEEQASRDREAVLPKVTAGPIGSWLDATVRQALRDGRPGALEGLKKGLARNDVPNGHVAALLRAIGGDPSLEGRLDAEAKEMADALAASAQALWEARGQDYPAALQAYLDAAGSGEQVS